MAVGVSVLDRPATTVAVELAAYDFRAELHATAHLPDAGGAGVPHHAGAAARVPEGIDQRLDDVAATTRPALRKNRVERGRRKGQALDALGCPVGRDLLAAHSPHLF